MVLGLFVMQFMIVTRGLQHLIGDTYELVLFIAHFLLVVSSLLISCLVEPSPHAEVAGAKPSPEHEANLFSLISFWWVSPLILKGYKAPLTSEGLPCLFDGAFQ